jgi:hypothetical protein
MGKSKVAGFVAAGLTIGLAAGNAARADSAPSSTYIAVSEQDVGVMERARPDYDPKGIPLGGFRLFPKLDASANFDDNVYKQENAQSDWYFLLSPAARVKSGWGRHFLEFYTGLNHFIYPSIPQLNLTDWNVGTDGRIDISRVSDVSVNVWYGQLHESWSAPNNFGYQTRPNRYFQAHTDIAAVYQPSRLGFRLGGSYDRYNWTRTPISGGGYLPNDDRDEDEYQAYGKVFYEFSPGYSGFVRAVYDYRQFDEQLDRSHLARSSHGYRVHGGVDLQITHLVKGEVFLGYMSQNFPQNVPLAAYSLQNLSGLDYGAQLDWYVSPILTLHLNGSRQIGQVILQHTSGADNKSISLSADYEFLRNVIVQANVSYVHSSYIGTTRTDDYPAAGLVVKYLINEYASADVSYHFSQRASNSPGVEFTDNLIGIGLTLQL